MSVNINLHKTHREFADGRASVPVVGSTVGACIDDLTRQYPGLQERLFDKKGKLRNFIEIYLNNESTYPDELKRTTQDGDEIHIVILLAGG
ncbi:MAG: MoaD/ThiS family protein [Desulfobacterales bacterium]|nr:MoaD/ThiS family protein [Desulfobacterales bacterium]